jgi:Na+-transporting methylmalonyl-CoA/oxaloacetate decarboxylase gamma subunit
MNPIRMRYDRGNDEIFLLLTIVGGAMVAVFAILLIILIGALGAWIAIQILSFKSQSEQRRGENHVHTIANTAGWIEDG